MAKKRQKANPSPAKPSENPLPDYANLNYWAAHPNKYDPADSLPKPYRNLPKDESVDVFFIHPTTYTNAEAVTGKPYNMLHWNAAIDNELLNTQTDNSTILNQASAFNSFNVYAPRYRQAHIRSFYLADSISKPFFDTAYADIQNAFIYYLQHYNQGKPFIIAAHSQGTLHAARLLKEKIENTTLQKQLVAAYIIGMAVPIDYFTALKPCHKPNATSCVIGWRTYKKGFTPTAIQEEKKQMLVINPVTFDMDKPTAKRKDAKAAVLYKFNKPKPQNISTQVRGNIVWSSKPRFFGNLFFTRKNYHIGDINLFWKDIRDNTLVRVAAFKQQQ